MKKLPSVSSLQAFEAAARLGSFTLAAEELNMAQSAISRQVRGLEDQLGARLFDLIRQRIILTGDGLMFLEEVRPILAKLEAASRRVSAHAVGIQPIEMATLPTFCSRWLIPRLPKFYEKNPRASLNFTSKFAAFSFDTQPFDLAIHFGKPDWPDTTMHHLFQEKMVAICSSEFLKKHNIRSDKDLAGVPLLHLTVRLGQWSNWFDQQGCRCCISRCGLANGQIGSTTFDIDRQCVSGQTLRSVLNAHRSGRRRLRCGANARAVR